MNDGNCYRRCIWISLLSLFLVVGLARLSFGEETPPSRFIFIQIDSMHPEYINFNSTATGPGSEGDWLMPRVRKFVLEECAHWPNAKAHFPSVTDVNVLNLLASGNSGNTGVLWVLKQPEYWGLFGLVRGDIHLGKARYPNGTQVRTIFDIIKEQSPSVLRAFISNKRWVPEQYGAGYGKLASVDIIIHGENYPPYLSAPDYVSFYDNPYTDPDAYCDPESDYQTTLLDTRSQNHPEEHPRDYWIADATLQVIANEDPDMIYVLLGDLDRAQHYMGTVGDPSEWKIGPAPALPPGCWPKFRYRWINKRNENLYKEPILDLVRDVDLAFGHLIDGLEEGGYLQDAVVVLFSDHNMQNYLYRDGIEQDTDVTQKLKDVGLAPQGNYGKDGNTSVGLLYWRPLYKLSNPSVVLWAKLELLKDVHKAYNQVTGVWELPWHVLDRQEMINGRLDLGIDAMEIYNEYFVQNGVWPDLVVVMKEGWQLPSPTIIVDETEYQVYNAGHGSPDTSAVMLAIKGLGFPSGVSCTGEANLSDVSITISKHMGWPFPEAIGKPLVCSKNNARSSMHWLMLLFDD